MNIIVDEPPDSPGLAVLHVDGDVDGTNYRQLISRAEAAYEAGARRLVIDLSQCYYVSSAGLVALHSIASLMRGETVSEQDSGWSTFRAIDREREGATQPNLRLAGLQPKVNRVLEMAGFKRFLAVYPDVPSAIGSF